MLLMRTDQAGGDLTMSYAIIRGKNNRRHEVDFGEDKIKVEIHANDSVVEIFLEADHDSFPEGRRRSALVSIPKELFSQAMGKIAKNAPLRLEDALPEAQTIKEKIVRLKTPEDS
jgi:hypothetical protein